MKSTTKTLYIRRLQIILTQTTQQALKGQVHHTFNMPSNLKRYMDMAAKGAYQLLQHHVWGDYKTSQKGNGMGGVDHRHNAPSKDG